MSNFTERDLNIIAKDMAIRNFGMEFNISVNINGRKNGSTFGTFRYVEFRNSRYSVKIDMSKRFVEQYKPETVLDTLLHEITHWACFERNKPFADGDYFFESELRRVGASSTRTKQHAGELYYLKCGTCGRDVGQVTSIRRANKYIRGYYGGKIYRTACCKGKFVLKTIGMLEDTYVPNEKIKAEYQRALELIGKSQIKKSVVSQQISPSKISQSAETHAPSKSVKNNEIIVPGRRGVTNAQMIPAIEKAVMRNDKEVLLQLKAQYPEIFESSKKYIKKSLQFRFYQMIG